MMANYFITAPLLEGINTDLLLAYGVPDLYIFFEN